MSLFLAMPILAATGLYNPQVVDRHHHCVAEGAHFRRSIVRHLRHPRHLLIIHVTLRSRGARVSPRDFSPAGRAQALNLLRIARSWASVGFESTLFCYTDPVSAPKMVVAMVGKRTKAEFARDGIKAVREQLEQGGYWEGEKQQAIKWLAEQSERKKTRDTKKLLMLARRTARDTRLTLVLAGFISLVLIAELVTRFFTDQWVH